VKWFLLLFVVSTLLADLPLPPGVKLEFGAIPLKDKEGKEEANIFFSAYFQSSDKPRPLTFCLNGGPGASSVWLHLGGVGPLRIKDAYKNGELEKNPGSFLPFTDLVFLDPVSTGFSKTATGVDATSFHSHEGDVESLGRAVIAFLDRFQKWDAPLYLLGESYGVVRVVGLAKTLLNSYQVATKGLILVSGPLDFLTIQANGSNDLPYALMFPTFAILEGLKEGKKAQERAIEAEKFLESTYQPALFLGDALPEEQQKELTDSLSQWTGMPKEEILVSFFRISPTNFRYMSERGTVFGRFDARVKTKAPYELPPFVSLEPSFTLLYGPFKQAMHTVLQGGGWKNETEQNYAVMADAIKWNFKTENCYLNVVGPLKELIYQLPHLQVISCNGYYDLAVPYYSVKYSLRQLLLDPETAKRVHLELFEGGHMFYLDRSVNEEFSKVIRSYYP